MAALIGLAVAGAAGSFWQASKAQKAQEEAQRAQERLAEEQAKKAEEYTSAQLARLEGETDRLRRGKTRDPLMEAAVMQGTRQAVSAETGRQQQAAGLSGAHRVRAAQTIAAAQSQGLLAVESSRQQRNMELNKLISQNMQAAAQVSQAGYAVQEQSRTQLESSRINARATLAGIKAQKGSAIIGAVAGAGTAFLGTETGAEFFKGLFKSTPDVAGAASAVAGAGAAPTINAIAPAEVIPKFNAGAALQAGASLGATGFTPPKYSANPMVGASAYTGPAFEPTTDAVAHRNLSMQQRFTDPNWEMNQALNSWPFSQPRRY